MGKEDSGRKKVKKIGGYSARRKALPIKRVTDSDLRSLLKQIYSFTKEPRQSEVQSKENQGRKEKESQWATKDTKSVLQ